ncbi:MAG: hypothetical protein OER83_03530 [Flavobacteriaceae bacterium]|nr:hypothetical protein [Flavobacteriaceae bacterium]MDH3795924.1 hypothetical protein [Flavobacteriaceae bacterium]
MKERQDNIQLVPYEPKYKEAFKGLNEAWIRQYFKMEDKDFESLEHPEETISSK